MCCGKGMASWASRWVMSFGSAARAARRVSSAPQVSGEGEPSRARTVLERVERTSETRWGGAGAKMEAKAVEVMGLGKGEVTEMGRWREKKVEAAMSAEVGVSFGLCDGRVGGGWRVANLSLGGGEC
jgi:hypothetical protein